MTGDTLTVLRDALDKLEREERLLDGRDFNSARAKTRSAALADVEALIEGLRWIEDFATRMRDTHTGFVHIERRARAALARFPATSPAKEQA